MKNNYKKKPFNKMSSDASEMPEPMGHERDESNYEKTIGLKGSAKTKYVKEKIKCCKDMGSMGD